MIGSLAVPTHRKGTDSDSVNNEGPEGLHCIQLLGNILKTHLQTKQTKQVQGWPRLIHENIQVTGAQIAKNVNGGSDRKVSEYPVHHSYLVFSWQKRGGGGGGGARYQAGGHNAIYC